jgi:hypothetical protein
MHQEMSDLKSDEKADLSDRRLSDVYELVMTPCETSVDMDMPDDTPSPPKVAHRKKMDVYVNFYSEPTSPHGPTTPSVLTPRTPDVHEKVIHIEIPQGFELYVNYEPFTFDSMTSYIVKSPMKRCSCDEL